MRQDHLSTLKRLEGAAAVQLEELQPKRAVEGVYPAGPVTVLSVQWYGSEAPELTYKTPSGAAASDLLYRDDEDCLRIL